MDGFVLISTSNSEMSSGRRYIPLISKVLEKDGHDCIIHDARTLAPFWMKPGCLSIAPEGYETVARDIDAAAGVIMIVPIYCYTASSIAKCLSEVFNAHLAFKPMAFVVTAGTEKSYLAVRDLMASVTFEQSTICYPKIHFDCSATTAPLSDENTARCTDLVQNFAFFSRTLSPFLERRNYANS